MGITAALLFFMAIRGTLPEPYADWSISYAPWFLLPGIIVAWPWYKLKYKQFDPFINVGVSSLFIAAGVMILYALGNIFDCKSFRLFGFLAAGLSVSATFLLLGILRLISDKICEWLSE